jgi:hypothetical protein
MSSATTSSTVSLDSHAFAITAVQESADVLWVVPVNEISFLAWAAGDVGIFNPFEQGRGDELKIQLVRATIRAIQSTHQVADVRIVNTDPMINVVADPARPEDAERAEVHRQAQYAAFDMVAGRSHPELGGREEYLGTLGMNYYIHNQWVYPGGHGMTIEPSRSTYRPVWQMLREVYERYGRPLFIGETGIEDNARPAWLRYIGYEVRRAIREGVPIQGICLYPIVNHPGWDDDRHCYNGLWDYPDVHGVREIYGPLVQELLEQQWLLEHDVGSERPSEPADTHALDIAAHWMEIRSGREDILHK